MSSPLVREKELSHYRMNTDSSSKEKQASKDLPFKKQ
jgi:hypothetical protein